MAQLIAEGHGECIYCLEEFQTGECITFMPCKGSHLGHKQCTEKWLTKARTCPICRFALPQSASETTRAALAEICKGAVAEKERLKNAMPIQLCQEVDEDMECEASDDHVSEEDPPHTGPLTAAPSTDTPRADTDDQSPRRGFMSRFRAMQRRWGDSWWTRGLSRVIGSHVGE